MNKYNYKNLQPFKWFVLENFPFIEADFDALTNWQLFCKLGKEMNKIIDSQNNVGEEMETISNAFIELQNYVNEYFDNLDVQEEINNKLDDMAESGELEQIISAYLNTITFKVYNTIADLKESALIDGQYAETLGYYSQNDGGNAKYVIVSGTYDEDDVEYVPLNNGKYAKLLTKYDNSMVNVKSFGAKGDGVTDDIIPIQNCILYCADNGLICFIPAGTYLISHQIITALSDVDTRANENFVIIGEGNNTKINKYGSDATFKEMFDFSYLKYLTLKNIYSDSLSLTLVPSAVYQQGFDYWSKWLKKKHFDFENVFGTSEGVAKLITLEAPAHAGRYGDKHYDDYPLKIVSNSGYNAIEIENFGYNLEDETSTPTDNSAIGIIDNITNSNGVINIILHGDRNFERYDNPNATVKSQLKPTTVYELSKTGHIAIGCSTDYNDPVAIGQECIKLRDSSPSIAFNDTNYQGSGYPRAIIRSHNGGFQIIVNGTYYANISQYGWTNLNIDKNNCDYVLKLNDSTGQANRYITIDSNNMLHFGYRGTDQDAHIPLVYAVENPTTSSLWSLRIPGFCVFNKTTNKPMWWSGTAWVYADGTNANIT